MNRTRCLLIFILLACICLTAQRINTTRRISKAKTVSADLTTSKDTVQCNENDLIFSGYEKALRSYWESVFVTNHTSDTIYEITFTIVYLDTDNRQLHKRTESLSTSIEPQDTRMLQFHTWDKNKVWYYYLSEPPRTKGQATPYKVKITANSYLK